MDAYQEVDVEDDLCYLQRSVYQYVYSLKVK